MAGGVVAGAGSPHPAGADEPGRAPTRRRWWWWRVTKWLAGLAGAGLAAWAVAGKTDELSGASGYLDRLAPGWVAVAVGAEAVSYLAFGALQRVLLRAGTVPSGLARLTGISLAGNAIQNSLPGGVVISAAFAFRQYRRLEADDVLCGWVVTAMTLLSIGSLTVLAAAGLAMAASTGTALDLAEVIVGTVVVMGLLVVAWARREWVVGHAVRLVRLSQRLTRRPGGDAVELVATARARMGAIAPDRPTWALAAGFAAANWMLDMGCLAAAYLAVGADVPWRGLLLAYAGAQLAANLPVTPGGLGVVEGSLTIALVAFGGAEATTVAAVLLYRLVNFWATLPIGWGCWGALALDSRRRRRLALQPATARIAQAGAR